jgi:hypothetical protein
MDAGEFGQSNREPAHGSWGIGGGENDAYAPGPVDVQATVRFASWSFD